VGGYPSFFVTYLKISLFFLICSGGSPEIHNILSMGLVRKAPIASRIADYELG
jgi:hypothetical protein